MSEKIGILTRDMRNGVGGASTVTKFTYSLLKEAGYQPYVIFNTIPWEECVTVKDLVQGKIRSTSEEGTFNEMRGIKIGRILPEFSVFDFLLNYRNWSRALERADKYLVVGGTCIQGLPLTIKGLPFDCWIGTTFRDQHSLQIDKYSFPRRLRNKLAFPLLHRYERRVLQEAETIFVQSSYTKNKVIEHSGVSGSKVEVLPFPIDTSKYKPNRPVNDNEVLFVGRINAPRKNTELLLHAFDQVLDSVPKAELTLVGEKPNDKLESVIANLDLESSVNSVGRVPDVVPYYQRASVFALPSNQEGLGIAGLEAQSCGTPIVTTNCGGPQEYVNNGENGYIVPIGDAEALADAILSILTDDSLRNELSENSRRTVVEQFSKEKIQSRLLDQIKSR